VLLFACSLRRAVCRHHGVSGVGSLGTLAEI
jgi:hypothetical protein